MKKSLIALAVLAAAGTASAQSSVTLFGIVDATLARGTGSIASKTQLTNSGYNSSRIGFRGTEDLGGGMSASFWLEGSLGNDDGTTGQRIPTGNQAAVNTVAGGAGDGWGLTFNRRSTVSLAGNWGELRLGRDYTPSFWNLTVFDPFGTNGTGTTVTLLAPALAGFAPPTTRNVMVRASNSFGYFLPGNLGGFYGQAMYALGENASNVGATKKDGDSTGIRLGWANGPINVALAYQRTKYAQTATTGDFKTLNVGGQWDFGVAQLMAQYSSDKKQQLVDLKGKGWLIGGLVPVGAGQVRASYSTYKIDAGPGADPRVNQWALGYVHNLSKRTALYATVARATNKNGSAYALNGSTTAANESSTGYDLGIRHSF